MGDHSERVELLAPAGSREAFVGAINAGADAVYLGGEKFGARAYADNFSDREIVRAIEEAHIFGRKVYLTANILTRESELADLTSFVSELYRAGLDGVIVQDLGVLSALREACPGLPLHASTQMSVTASESVQYLRRMGVSRVVPARELSLREIDQLRREDAARNGRPVVKITAIEKKPVSRRIGVAEGKFTMPDDFDADNEYIADLFMGGSL